MKWVTMTLFQAGVGHKAKSHKSYLAHCRPLVASFVGCDDLILEFTVSILVSGSD